MASHDELMAELQKLEKLSHAARLKHAKKRRQKQLKKYQEWLRYDRQTSASMTRKRALAKISFENSAVLNDLVSRNDLIGGKAAGYNDLHVYISELFVTCNSDCVLGSDLFFCCSFK